MGIAELRSSRNWAKEGIYTTWVHTVTKRIVQWHYFFSSHDYKTTIIKPQWQLIKIARQHGDRMSPENKLRIGYQVATAIGDLHSVDGDTPSVTHNDLCCHQFILIDGVYKLNDFHLASTLKQDRKGNACLDPPKGMNSNVRMCSRTIQKEGNHVTNAALYSSSLTRPELPKNWNEMDRFIETRQMFGSWAIFSIMCWPKCGCLRVYRPKLRNKCW
jgi:hypothetical protein